MVRSSRLVTLLLVAPGCLYHDFSLQRAVDFTLPKTKIREVKISWPEEEMGSEYLLVGRLCGSTGVAVTKTDRGASLAREPLARAARAGADVVKLLNQSESQQWDPGSPGYSTWDYKYSTPNGAVYGSTYHSGEVAHWETEYSQCFDAYRRWDADTAIAYRKRYAEQFAGSPGLLVLAVHASGPAAVAGVKPGDFLLRFEGEPVTMEWLQRLGGAGPAGALELMTSKGELKTAKIAAGGWQIQVRVLDSGS